MLHGAESCIEHRLWGLDFPSLQKVQEKDRKVLSINRAECEKDLLFAGFVAFNCLNRSDSKAVLVELKCVQQPTPSPCSRSAEVSSCVVLHHPGAC